MRILFLEHLFPLPADSGGKIKSYSVLKALASCHEVAMLTYWRAEDDTKHVQDLLETCVSVTRVPICRSKAADLRDAAVSLMSGSSFIVRRDFRKQMAAEFRRVVKEFRPHAVHIDHLQMAQFVEFDSDYFTVLDQHNVEHVIIRRIADTAENPAVRFFARREWPRLRDYELMACRRSGLVLTVSEEDRSELCRLEPSLENVHAVPIGIDFERYSNVQPAYGSPNVLFTGTMYWPPNVDCVQYFCRDILPLVRQRVPECTFTIAGHKPSEPVKRLAAERGVEVTGYVEDDREVAGRCGVFVVPLRSGSGVRVKILNAMAMGLPVVSTSVGAEGIDAVSGEHLIIADSPTDFADAVADLLADARLAQRIGGAARQLAGEKYSWQKAGERVLDLYGRFVQPGNGCRRGGGRSQ